MEKATWALRGLALGDAFGETWLSRPADEVGSGALISASDTVPYALWCAARHLDDLVEALWTTAAGGGDVDTSCAVVGGVVGARTRLSGVPPEWVDACEDLPSWVG